MRIMCSARLRSPILTVFMNFVGRTVPIMSGFERDFYPAAI